MSKKDFANIIIIFPNILFGLQGRSPCRSFIPFILIGLIFLPLQALVLPCDKVWSPYVHEDQRGGHKF